MREFSGISLIETGIWSEPDSLCAGDACLTGGGAFTELEYFSISFPDIFEDVPIHILEFIVLIISCKVWGPQWGRLCISVYCDNESVVQTITNQKPKDEKLQSCLRELLFLESKYSFRIRAIHISTKKNHVADYISRVHDDTFIQEYFKAVGLKSKRKVDIPTSFYLQWNSW